MKTQIKRYKMIAMIFLVIFTYSFESCDKYGFDSGGLSNKANDESSAVAVGWYELQLKMTLTANPAISPLVANRTFGFIGIGLYESVKPGIKNSISLSEKLYQMPPMPEKENNNGYSWGVSANAALAKLVASFYPPAVVSANQQRIDSLEAAYNDLLKPKMKSAVFNRSQAFGRSVADAIIAWAQTDNSNLSNAGYTLPVFPGSWVPTPPAFANALSPFFESTRPFLEQNLEAISPPFIHDYSEVLGSDFYKMGKDLYDQSKALTTEQKNIALYWNDVGVGIGYLPPGHSVSILTQIVKNEKISLGEAAMAYAKTGIALHDAIIACWKSKFMHNLLRPVSYIQKVIDPSWTPTIITPPFPEYPAAHAFITAAFMQTMTGLFGDNYSFTDNTYQTKYGGPRTYSSFNAAAEECGMSRYYGGIHYLPSIEDGLELGKEIGLNVNSIQLTRNGDR